MVSSTAFRKREGERLNRVSAIGTVTVRGRGIGFFSGVTDASPALMTNGHSPRWGDRFFQRGDGYVTGTDDKRSQSAIGGQGLQETAGCAWMSVGFTIL